MHFFKPLLFNMLINSTGYPQDFCHMTYPQLWIKQCLKKFLNHFMTIIFFDFFSCEELQFSCLLCLEGNDPSI